MKTNVVVLLAVIIIIGCLNLHALPAIRADSTGGECTFGSVQYVTDKVQVTTDHNIDPGTAAWVFTSQVLGTKDVPEKDWYALIRGDLTSIRDAIEKDVANSKVVWVRIAWNKAEPYVVGGGPHGVEKIYYHISGFQIEAIIKNTASPAVSTSWSDRIRPAINVKPVVVWTAALVIAIILGIAFLATVLTLLGVGTWLVFQIMGALGELKNNLGGFWGPLIYIVVGLGILFGVGFLLFVLLGGRMSYQGKKRGFSVGKAAIFLMRDENG